MFLFFDEIEVFYDWVFGFVLGNFRHFSYFVNLMVILSL